MDKTESEKEELKKAFDEALHMLDNYEVPQPITVNIETEEDRNFWFNMMLHGHITL